MNFTRGPIIGRGSTAEVSLATVVSTGQTIAVKSTHLSKSSLLQKEVSFLSKLNSPYIINYLDYNVTKETTTEFYNLCVEYAPGGTLRDEIGRKGGRLSEEIIRLYTNQILQGLNYLHSNNLVHCDVKSENVLVIEEGLVKIGDLGCAKLGGGNNSAEFSGTPVFMSPEVARREDQGFPADVWGVGCVVIEMATGLSPWPEQSNPVSALYKIGFSGERPVFPGWLSEEGQDFLDKCLRVDPIERWSAEELLQHPFLVSDLKSVHCFDGFKNLNLSSLNSNSPCSVLNHGVWDHESSDLDSGSAYRRIQDLIGECSNWEEDDDGEDWITVRSNEIEENRTENDDVFDLLSEEQVQENDDFMSEFNDEDVNTSFVSSISNVVSFSREDFELQDLDFEMICNNYCLIQSQLKQYNTTFKIFNLFSSKFPEKHNT